MLYNMSQNLYNMSQELYNMGQMLYNMSRELYNMRQELYRIPREPWCSSGRMAQEPLFLYCSSGTSLWSWQNLGTLAPYTTLL